MQRRRFFRIAAVCGSVSVLGGGGLFLKRSYATANLEKRLNSAATPLLAEKALKELESVPQKGRDEIRDWFHGKCLDVALFVEEVCSTAFQLKLKSCTDKDSQSNLILVSFFGKVVSESEILGRIQMICEESGKELDRSWTECCKAIGSAWGVYLKDYPTPFDSKEFLERIDVLVQGSIEEEIRLASTSRHFMTWADLPGSIGATALSLLPSSDIQISLTAGVKVNPLFIPTFILLALRDFTQYVLDRFVDPKPNLRTAVSDRLSLLGNRVGAEYHDALRQQVARLQKWQEDSISKAAESWANSATGWI